MKEIIFIGFSGHAKVVLDSLVQTGQTLKGYFEKEKKDINQSYLGSEVDSESLIPFADKYFFHIPIGDNKIRKRLVNSLSDYNLRWENIIHPNAYVAVGSSFGVGNFISVNSIINPSVTVGNFNIINSNALLEHDATIGDYCHIAPGAVICGGVTIGDNSFVGANATIKENVTICANVTCGAGAVVVKNICEPGVYVGTPAIKLI